VYLQYKRCFGFCQVPVAASFGFHHDADHLPSYLTHIRAEIVLCTWVRGPTPESPRLVEVHAARRRDAIVDAIIAGDPDAARRAVAEHLEGTGALQRGFPT
jgi:hypothetical protein